MSAGSNAPRARTNPAKRRFHLEDHLFFHFTQILARRTRAINREIGDFGLDYARWRVMAVVHDQGECSMGGLAELSSVDRTTLTRTVAQMEAEGLIARRTSPGDRRRLSISLTAHGERLFGRILPIVLACTQRALAGFTPDEASSLRIALRRMADNLLD